MKAALAAALFFAVALPAYAGPILNPVPEIDGSLTIQFLALAGGLAMILKRKR